MNWSRGLFRVWLVLSAIWVSSTIFFTAPWTKHPFAPAFWLNNTLSAPDGPWIQYQQNPPARRTFEVEINGQVVSVEARDQESAIAAAQSVRSEYQPIMYALAITALPPIFLLVAGLVVGWIVRGFHRSHTVGRS